MTTLTTATLKQLGFLLPCLLLLSACGSDTPTPSPPLEAAIHAPTSIPVLGPVLTPVLAPILTMEDSLESDWRSNMNGDALEAPAQPELDIRAAPAALLFDWTPIAGQRSARLYHHDTLLPGETLVFESDDPQLASLQLPINSPGTAWHREQYRLEMCTADNCVSSARRPLINLAAATQQRLSPAVYFKGERYGEQLALNRDASLAIIGMPLEGALEFQIRTGSQWVLTQHLRLEDAGDSMTRTLYPSSSATGDTVALYLSDEVTVAGQKIQILERLGEAWVQTHSWSLDANTSNDSVDDVDNEPDGSEASRNATHDPLHLSADGDHLLLQTDDSLRIWSRNGAGWNTPGAAPRMLIKDGHYTTSTVFQTALTGNGESTPPARIVGSTASRLFERIAALVELDGRLYLDIWQATDSMGAWQHSAHLQLFDFDTNHELALQLGAQGDELLIAGWEVGAPSIRTPILWRYSLNTTPGSLPSTIVLQHNDSLRAVPTTHAEATLVFSADESLTLATMGWQLAGEADASERLGHGAAALPDAAVSTWQYHSSSRQWLSALELPEAIPTLAKQAFANGVRLSADGSTLMMALPGNSAGGNNGGTVLVLR